MATVCPDTDHFIGDFDPDRRRDAVAQLRSQLSVVAELGGAGVLTPASWACSACACRPSPRPASRPRTARCCWRRSLELAEHAAAEGVWLAVEPINRYEDHMVNRLKMDFRSVFDALAAVGYDDWLTFECRLRGEPEEALPASTRFLARFL